MGIISNPPGQMKPDKGSSAQQNTSVGSGSRPTKSSFPIDTSAPSEQQTLGRADGTSPLK